MSEPRNPLDALNAPPYRHVLIAFKYAEDAYNVNITPNVVDIGQSIPDAGPNMVLVNELKTQKYAIPEAVWDFNFIPDIGVYTTSSVGRIRVDDQYVALSFIDFLKFEVLGLFNEGEPDDNLMSLGHATFVLKTFFSGSNAANTPDTINVNPYYFNVQSIESLGSNSDSITPDSHILHVMGSANSFPLLRSFQSIYQLNVTHRDGNIHDTIPTGTGTGSNVGLRTRSEENRINTSKRKNRLDLSKPMLTLKDVFEGLEADLNQQKYVNKAQLQRWIRQVRSEGDTDKIVVPPIQSKPPLNRELPMDFVIDLDPVYADYNIDNRNMPFEQPDVRQENVGIRVFPTETGTLIFELIKKIMMLSKRVGEEAGFEENRLSYKITLTATRTRTNRYTINIKIRRYSVPINEENINNGPGENAVEPLTFFLNDPQGRDTDILSFKSHLNYEVGDKMLEQALDDSPSKGIVYADREQATAQRRPDLPFFQTPYSGIRPIIGYRDVDGLENAQRAGDILNLMDPYTYTQTTEYKMIIRGNPFLLSDVNRNPLDVINDEDGHVEYYARPEVNPMYVKITIYESSSDNNTLEIGDAPNKFYFDNFYHLARVINIFSSNSGRGFHQHLIMRRGDTLV
jgi:hypothetical protein